MITTKHIRSFVPLFIFCFILVLADPAISQPQTPILGGAKERQPGYGEMENFTILSYSDLDGWDQAAEFRVSKEWQICLRIELSRLQHRRCQRSVETARDLESQERSQRSEPVH